MNLKFVKFGDAAAVFGAIVKPSGDNSSIQLWSWIGRRMLIGQTGTLTRDGRLTA